MSPKIKRTKVAKISRKSKRLPRVGKTTALITSSDKKLIQWIELGVAALLIFILIIIHFIVFLHSGVLWRDEIATINLISLPSVVEMVQEMHHDSFPILWLLVLRIWSFIGFGTTEFALRALGLIVGLGILGALWYTVRSLGMRLPLISLVLFAMCPTVFVGDSLRAYGLGVLLILLVVGTMWRVVQNPTPWRMVASAAAVILSVHCLYHNSFLIFSICVSAAAVGLYRRQWKLTLFPLGVGAVAATTVLPYLGIVSTKGVWNIIHKFPITLSWIFNKFQQAIDPFGSLLTWIWALLAVFAVISFVRLLKTPALDRSGKQKDLAVFLLIMMSVSIISYITFIKILAYRTQNWYYLPLMAVLIIIIDRGIEAICENNLPGRIIRIVFVLGVAGFIFMDSLNAAHIRKTNMDLLAAKLEELSQKDDLIVVAPFYHGISFFRYYKGSATWLTLPEVSDHSIHRYDLFKIKMTQNEPIKPILQKMIRTLQDGHKVWLVGEWNFLKPGEIPVHLPPAPNSPYGWSEIIYQASWSDMAAFTLRKHGRSLERITIPTADPVSELENVRLLMVQGWCP